MPRDPTKTRLRILNAAYVLFRRQGFARVGVEEIAASANVTKRTLYDHFKSKDALLAAVLEHQHELAFGAFQTFGDALSGTCEQMIDKLFSGLADWTKRRHWTGSGFTRVAMELADLPGHPARAVARRHKTILETYLADLFARTGVDMPSERAREVWMLAEGAMVMVLIHGDRRYVDAAARAAKKLVQDPLRTSPTRNTRNRC